MVWGQWVFHSWPRFPKGSTAESLTKRTNVAFTRWDAGFTQKIVIIIIIDPHLNSDLMIYRAMSVMSRALTGRNMLSTTCKSTLPLSLQPSTEHTDCSQLKCQWKSISCFFLNRYLRSLQFVHRYSDFATQFYTQQHRVILGVTASVIPRDTLFICKETH